MRESDRMMAAAAAAAKVPWPKVKSAWNIQAAPGPPPPGSVRPPVKAHPLGKPPRPRSSSPPLRALPKASSASKHKASASQERSPSKARNEWSIAAAPGPPPPGSVRGSRPETFFIGDGGHPPKGPPAGLVPEVRSPAARKGQVEPGQSGQSSKVSAGAASSSGQEGSRVAASQLPGGPAASSTLPAVKPVRESDKMMAAVAATLPAIQEKGQKPMRESDKMMAAAAAAAKAPWPKVKRSGVSRQLRGRLRQTQ